MFCAETLNPVFSIFTEGFLLFCMSVPFWHMMMIQLAARVSVKQIVLVSSIMLAWTFWAYGSIRYGLDTEIFGDQHAWPLIYLIIASFTVWCFQSRLLGRGVSQHLLIGLQLFRPIGLIFVFEWSRGTLPGIFAHPAGWGDLIAGMVAAFVLCRYWRKEIPSSVVILVAVIGFIDFFFAFFFGFTTSQNPAQLFCHEFPNRVIEYPLGLIPTFLVPYAVIAHILSLAQLRKRTLSKDTCASI